MKSNGKCHACLLLGFAMVLDTSKNHAIGSVGEYYWGGAASTIFWIDPAEELVVVFMVQLMPSGTFNFRGNSKVLFTRRSSIDRLKVLIRARSLRRRTHGILFYA